MGFNCPMMHFFIYEECIKEKYFLTEWNQACSREDDREKKLFTATMFNAMLEHFLCGLFLTLGNSMLVAALILNRKHHRVYRERCVCVCAN